jgi:hypothetical protein
MEEITVATTVATVAEIMAEITAEITNIGKVCRASGNSER